MFYCNLYFKKEGTTKANVFALSVNASQGAGTRFLGKQVTINSQVIMGLLERKEKKKRGGGAGEGRKADQKFPAWCCRGAVQGVLLLPTKPRWASRDRPQHPATALSIPCPP